MQPDDAAGVARLHLQSLPPSFFARLGPRFLTRYYESYVASPHGVALVATRGDRLCGYVVGSSAADDHSAWTLRSRGARLALAGALALLTRPRLAVWFLRSRAGRYARGIRRRLAHRAPAAAGHGAAGVPAGEQSAVLAHIAVDGTQRRTGAGAVLVSAFTRELAQRGVASFELVTLSGPEGAGAFYERLGLTPVRERTDGDGRTWCYYVHRAGGTQRS